MIVRRLYNWPQSQNSFSELERMRSQMDNLFGRLTGYLPAGLGPGVFPAMNVTEDKDNLYVRAELPGMKAEEINISATGNTLSIAGERRIAPESEEASYHRRERESGTFHRTLTLPNDIDPGKVKAHYRDGILTLTLPKAEAAKPRQITVKAA